MINGIVVFGSIICAGYESWICSGQKKIEYVLKSHIDDACQKSTICPGEENDRRKNLERVWIDLNLHL